ncbi:MAG: septal ring lytic transglycosylase RlpA family protein [Deltaproteobacteria bacterium]|nr:septal ring lytic transglycosylase RlpA family protein [Deltaproteobacteria bacterium]
MPRKGLFGGRNDAAGGWRLFRPLLPVVLLALLLLLGACSFFRSQKQSVTPSSSGSVTRKLTTGFYRQGVASWYGHPFHGCPTASGAIYDMDGMTAANKELPLGTRVRVTNLENGREVEVVINDRGPFVKNRIIDLSRAAARRLAMIGQGTALVRIDILELPENFSVSKKHPFAIQFGAYSSREQAVLLKKKLSRFNPDVYIETVTREDGPLYRVRLGWFKTRGEARSEALRMGQDEALIFRR